MADTRRQQKPIKLLKTGIMSSGKTSNVLKLLTAIFFVHIVKTETLPNTSQPFATREKGLFLRVL